MNVLIVNTSEKTGGAAVAASRLKTALRLNGVEVKMLVRDKETYDNTVVSVGGGIFSRWHFLWERLQIFFHLHFSRDNLFLIDTALAGHDITSLPEFKEADIIHLHWVNQGMLSVGDIRKILESGKPVVWTMHDLWPATSLCHYARGCDGFENGCCCCPLLPHGGSRRDLSARVWQKKYAVIAGHRIWFVACSKWLRQQAMKSALLKVQPITDIPNTIDTKVFRPTDKTAARLRLGLPLGKHVILFVSQKVTDERKGMDYFARAIERLGDVAPSICKNTCIAVLGGHAGEVASLLSLPVFPLGYVSDTRRIVDVYNAADVFVLPSLEDNLPNTIMESMACGVPCVGFHVGGIPEMIDHMKNGYVARYRDCLDLAEGMRWVLQHADDSRLRSEAVGKVAHSYSQQLVASRYIEVYGEAIKVKRNVI